MSEERPIFLVIADQIAADILVGTYPEDAQVPSTTELAVFYRVNPATAGKALTRLVEDGVVYKRRGLGMFVAPGAPEALRRRRVAAFVDDFVRPLIDEGRRLGLTGPDIVGQVQAHVRAHIQDPIQKELP